MMKYTNIEKETRTYTTTIHIAWNRAGKAHIITKPNWRLDRFLYIGAIQATMTQIRVIEKTTWQNHRVTKVKFIPLLPYRHEILLRIISGYGAVTRQAFQRGFPRTVSSIEDDIREWLNQRRLSKFANVVLAAAKNMQEDVTWLQGS